MMQEQFGKGDREQRQISRAQSQQQPPDHQPDRASSGSADDD